LAKLGLGYEPKWTLESGVRDYFAQLGFASR
jgi:nucleoside-diphosphate-sugar epimerase